MLLFLNSFTQFNFNIKSHFDETKSKLFVSQLKIKIKLTNQLNLLLLTWVDKKKLNRYLIELLTKNKSLLC